MCEEYPVMMGASSVGTVVVKLSGLYYEFNCKCVFPQEGTYCIFIKSGDFIRSLGTCVPLINGFGLTTRIPAKYFVRSDMAFTAVDKNGTQEGKYIPLTEELPFAHLATLEKGSYCRINGKPYLRINMD